MSSFFVSRHAGAIDWATRHGHAPDYWVEHLDIARIRSGDRVVGTLPVPMAAEVCALGAQYLHLDVPQRLSQRGHELSADDLDELGASVQPYWIERGRP